METAQWELGRGECFLDDEKVTKADYGTRPFFDANSKSRTEALAEEAGAKTNLPIRKAEGEQKEQVLTGSA